MKDKMESKISEEDILILKAWYRLIFSEEYIYKPRHRNGGPFQPSHFYQFAAAIYDVDWREISKLIRSPVPE